MHKPLFLIATLALLGGCASHGPADPGGTWINQQAIDDAVKTGSLRKALLADGPNLEWKVDSKASEATFFSNGFETVQGTLQPTGKGQWGVSIYGSGQETISLNGRELIQAASDNGPEQHFQRAPANLGSDLPLGNAFEQQLYAAFLSGTWKIVDGQGNGGNVSFQPDGRVDGLPGVDHFALCLGGDCASMSGENDSIWLERNKVGNAYLFRRDGKRLEILEAANTAAADEMPAYQPGARRWLLQQ